MSTEDSSHPPAGVERLSESLADREAGELFQSDLVEARHVAALDPRFASLVEGLQAPSLGARLAAVDGFFKAFDPVELAALDLPPHLSELRAIFLGSG